ncbi:MAG: hypothetical protein ACK5LP_00465 [Campylobacteraceae bacterium]
MNTLLLYFHILFASVWIGGMITLVGFIVYSKGEKSAFFYKFTNFYGWLNIFVLMFLVLSGVGLFCYFNLFEVLHVKSELQTLLFIKIGLVCLNVLATFTHSFIILKKSPRTKWQNILSKSSSFFMLFSSFYILYIAMKLRDLL